MPDERNVRSEAPDPFVLVPEGHDLHLAERTTEVAEEDDHGRALLPERGKPNLPAFEVDQERVGRGIADLRPGHGRERRGSGSPCRPQRVIGTDRVPEGARTRTWHLRWPCSRPRACFRGDPGCPARGRAPALGPSV